MEEDDDEGKRQADSPALHRAAHLVSFILTRSLSSKPEGPLTQLGFLCVKALWMSERASIAHLIQLESLVADRFAEEKRGLRAVAREQRRLERELRKLQEKREALKTYQSILNAPPALDDEVSSEDYDDDDDEEEDDEYYEEQEYDQDENTDLDQNEDNEEDQEYPDEEEGRTNNLDMPEYEEVDEENRKLDAGSAEVGPFEDNSDVDD